MLSSFECLFGDTNLCKLEVQNIFAILSEAYLEPSRTYVIELFAKIIDSQSLLTIFAKRLDVSLRSKYTCASFYPICTKMGLHFTIFLTLPRQM